MSEARALQSHTNVVSSGPEPGQDEQDPQRSARFRIRIDALGRIVPEVVSDDATEAEPVAR